MIERFDIGTASGETYYEPDTNGRWVRFGDIAEFIIDALRYRYLRDTHHLRVGPDAWIRTGEDLDEAVDAGMDSK